MHRFRVSSRLAAPPGEVWERAVSVEGINHELGPWVRMTVPRGLDLGALRAGHLGRSWILLFGVLPVDYDDIGLAVLEEGKGFRERSTMASASAWHHDRELVPLAGGGTRVVDEIGFAPRLGLFGGLQAFVFQAMFRWRHRRLRGLFGKA